MKQGNLDRRALAFLAVSHSINDVNQGAIPALLPFLVVERGLTYVAASGVVLAATIISSLIQPCLGYYSDRHPLPWLMPAGVLIGGLGIALAGVAPSYWLVLASVLVSGAGVAAFHPEGSRFANYVAGPRASGMGYFTLGGTIGFALGPVMITPLVLHFGLPGTMLMVLPALIVTLGLARELPHLITFRPAQARTAKAEADAPARWSPFIRVTAVIVLRTSVYFGMMSFVPLYYVKVRGLSIAEANSALTVMLIAGALGALSSGYLAERFGLRKVLVGSLAAIAPLILAFVGTSGSLGVICLAMVGVATVGGSTVCVLLGQRYLMSQIGVASGITLGLAIGLGGLAVPILGLIADHYGLTAALYSLTALPLVAIVLAATLPR